MSDMGPSGGRRGIRRSLLALLHARAFFGLLPAGVVLLVVTVAPVVVGGLGLGQLLQDLLRGRLSLDGEDRTCLINLLIGLACCRFVLPVALLGVRQLARRTRLLSARWCGIGIREAYA